MRIDVTMERMIEKMNRKLLRTLICSLLMTVCCVFFCCTAQADPGCGFTWGEDGVTHTCTYHDFNPCTGQLLR